MIDISNGSDLVRIDPLGARVTALFLSGVSILREDNGTNAKRSGIPILGPLVDANVGIWQEVSPSMPQHGTDRITTWDIIDQQEASLTLRRTYDGIDHPLIGEATIVFSIDDEHCFSLIRSTSYSGDLLIPVGTGLHTYFSPHASFNDINVFPVENGRSYHLDGMSDIYMTLDGKRFLISAQPEPLETVVWTENSDDHICVEPWWAHVGDGPIMTPGETRIESYTIRCIV